MNWNFTLDRYRRLFNSLFRRPNKRHKQQIVKLTSALLQRGVSCQLLYSKTTKTFDIVVPEAKVAISMRAFKKSKPLRKVMVDLSRASFTYPNEGQLSLYIDNTSIENNLDETVDWLLEVLNKIGPI